MKAWDELARKPARSVCIVVPMAHGGGVTGPTAAMITDTRVRCAARGIAWNFIPLHGLDQAHARAELAGMFQWLSGCEDLLCLDADNSFPAPWLDEVLCRSEEDLLVGPYPLRTLEGWALDTEGEDVTVERREGLRMLPVRGAGMGCVRIRKRALVEMQAAYPELEFESDSSAYGDGERRCWDLWRPLVSERRELVPSTLHAGATFRRTVRRRRPDDMSFFERARAAGLTARVLVDMPVDHAGKSARLADELGGGAPSG